MFKSRKQLKANLELQELSPQLLPTIDLLQQIFVLLMIATKAAQLLFVSDENLFRQYVCNNDDILASSIDFQQSERTIFKWRQNTLATMCDPELSITSFGRLLKAHLLQQYSAH